MDLFSFCHKMIFFVVDTVFGVKSFNLSRSRVRINAVKYIKQFYISCWSAGLKSVAFRYREVFSYHIICNSVFVFMIHSCMHSTLTCTYIHLKEDGKLYTTSPYPLLTLWWVLVFLLSFHIHAIYSISSANVFSSSFFTTLILQFFNFSGFSISTYFYTHIWRTKS